MQGMPHREKDAAVSRTILATSLWLWMPHTAALLYVAHHDGGASLLSMLIWTACIVGATVLTATKCERGDWLMVLSYAIGVVSESRFFSLDPATYYSLPRWIWVMVSALHGLISGIMCKAKDMEEGRYYEGHTIAERLYLVLPFTLGEWTGFIITTGWSGVLLGMATIFLCLSTVGYGVFTYNIIRYFGISGDLIGLVSRLFTTSFGVVFSSMVLFGAFVFYLAIPFVQSLMYLNALVGAIGIIMEISLYEIA
jgi:hypothetical protein